jgi:putrescine transport system ATP-binding protein
MAQAQPDLKAADLASVRAAAAPIMLRFETVTKRFGDFTAVDNVSLDVFAGEFFALLGPSGCGKTTLMRLVAGFEAPDAGRVLLDAADLAGRPPHRRPVNMMFQSYALFPHMSVERNIAFGLRQDGMSRRAVAERVSEMLALVQLEGLEGRKPHQLSGGQRQRVALARALAKRPKVLLLDEPLAALDKRMRQETQAQLVNLQRQLGATFVIVTHDQEEAMTLAGRMAVMDRGRIAQVGTPAEIYEQPNSRYVASFIGDINLIEGAIVRAEAGVAQVDCGAAGYFRTVLPSHLAPGARVTLALRPEKLRIAHEPPGDVGANAVAGTIEAIGYLGDVSVYQVRIAGGLLLRAAVPNRTRTAARENAVGDRLWLVWPTGAGVLLDR